mmetsp:Transcript_99117/g.250275  ORF Transcript_99117/g.250275 Transcript_99117/m.250275 type:complete len:678 (-) Transcript_99117:190-2223(-)
MQPSSFFLISGVLVAAAGAQNAEERIGCTAIAVDGAATEDGSAFAGMNADSGDADYRLTFVPPRQHIGGERPIFTFNLSYPRWVGFGRGEFFHPKAGHALSEPVGHIPEVKSTFGYYEATEPLFNDQGLGFGESSCAAMLVNKFPGDEKDTRDVPIGLLDTVTLMQLALERCATARCGVELMGELAEKFGFVPTPGEPTLGSVRGQTAWDDAGEAYTLADSKGEAWVFHVLGGVSGITKSVWVAQKVPKGHFALVANEFIIGELPSEPNEEFLFNREIFQAAKVAGLWDGVGPLHFSRTFAPEAMAFESPAGTTPIPLYAALRRWGLMNLAAPSLQLPFKSSNDEYPFSVRPDKVLSHRDVMGFLRYQYEGTEFDMTKGILAGPFGTPFRLEGGPRSGQVPRGIAITRTLYSIIAHTGPKRQLAWFAMDTPTTSVYVPLYSRSRAVSSAYATGHSSSFSRDSASWAFNFVSNFMQLNYRDMSKQDVYPAIESWQDTIDEERKTAEGSDAEAFDAWQAGVQEKVVASWWNMSDYLIMKYNDGRVNVPKVGRSPGYPQWYADMVGFGNDVHPVWVQPAPQPPASLISEIDGGYVAPSFQLPLLWDPRSSTWAYAPLPAAGAGGDTTELASPLPGPASDSVPFAAAALSTLAALLAGVLVGRGFERRALRSAAGAGEYLL